MTNPDDPPLAHLQTPTHDALSPLSVRSMGPEELAWAAAEHRHHFPDGFFARLGEPFLQEYYRSFMTSPSACLLVALEGDQPVGYIAGILDTASHRASLLSLHRRSLAIRAAGGMLRRPSLVMLFLRTRARTYGSRLFRFSGGRVNTSTAAIGQAPPIATDDRRTPAVLSHLAVHPACRCRGIGRRLVADFVRQAQAAARTEVVLVTEVDGPGQGFYRRLGWCHTDTRTTREGRGVMEFRLTLTEATEKETQVRE